MGPFREPCGRATAGLAMLLLLAGCALKQAQPVELVQPGDDALSCRQLQAEFSRNWTWAETLRSRDGQRVQTSARPLGVTVDAAPDPEGRLQALDARNERLQTLAAARGCPPSPEPRPDRTRPTPMFEWPSR